jgi:type II secretory pathway pseudopilin PulG
MPPIRDRRGISLVELLIVVTMIGLLSAIIVPRFRVTPATRLRQAARQLALDLEYGRSRALATRSPARVAFATTGTLGYSGFLDFDRDGVFAQSAAESDSLAGFRARPLEPRVGFGRPGGVPDLPALPGTGAITLPNARIDFDTRGLTAPFGIKGVIYLTHADDPTAAAAVSITAAAGIRAWVYQNGSWR